LKEDSEAFNLSIIGDYVAWDFSRLEMNKIMGRTERCIGCIFLNLETTTVHNIRSVYKFQALNASGYSYTSTDNTEYVTFAIHEPSGSFEIAIWAEDEVQHVYRPTSSRGKLVFCYSTSTDRERLRVWQMDRRQEHPSEIEEKPTLIHDRSRESGDLRIEGADENFIMTVGRSDRSEFRTLYLTSHFTDALIDVRALTVWKCQEFRYDRGLLFQNRGLSIVRILDVASGVHLNDVRLPLEREADRSLVSMLRVWASSNENVIVIGWHYVSLKTQSVQSILSVYSREAVVQQQHQPHHSISFCVYPIYNLRLATDMDIEDFEMDETRIAVIGVKRCRKNGKRIVSVLHFTGTGSVGKGTDVDIHLEE
jgi:hypothetical protein